MKDNNKKTTIFFDGKSMTAKRLAKILMELEYTEYDFSLDSFLAELNKEMERVYDLMTSPKDIG